MSAVELQRPIRNERGAGLLMALLIMAAVAVIATGLMSSIISDRRLSSYNLQRANALNLAEAGVAEALERIRMGDVPSNYNPRMVSQIYRTQPGAVPSVGADTIAMATSQPQGRWLPYSSDVSGQNVLTVQYMTDAARTGIYRYDPAKTPAVQGVSGVPVFVITSPAVYGKSRHTVEATIAQSSIQPNLLSGYTAKEKIKFEGPIYGYGYDYRADTPYGVGNNGNRDAAWEVGTSRAGAWSGDKIEYKDGSKLYGTPVKSEYQSGFYEGPWQTLNMNQSQFWNWIGPPIDDKKIDVPRGLTYLGRDQDPPQSGKGKFKIKGGNGDGILYVNGDLEIKGDFTFRGLIYVEGDLKIKGTAWILGAVVVADRNKVRSSKNTNITILSSPESVALNIGKYGGRFVILGWRDY